MEHKKKKGIMGFALLLCAMVALVGVGFALAYQGSATTPVDDTSDEFIKVGINNKTGIFDADAEHPAPKIYTVDTLNNGSTITVDSLKVGDDDATLVTGKYFVYSSAFSIANEKNGYESSVAGSISLSVLLSSGATTSGQAFEMAITHLNAGVLHPNGVSLLYTYKIGTGNETILDLNNLPTVTLEAGTPVDVIFTAYVVYKMSVNTNDFDTGSFAIAGNSDVRFTFSVPTA